MIAKLTGETIDFSKLGQIAREFNEENDAGLHVDGLDQELWSCVTTCFRNLDIAIDKTISDFDILDSVLRIYSVVTKHLSNIFKEGELDENSTCANFAQVADNGKTYNYKFYSLAAIIADVSGSIRLFSDVMKRLEIKLDGDELYDEFQRIYDKSVSRGTGKDKAEYKMWNRGGGR